MTSTKTRNAKTVARKTAAKKSQTALRIFTHQDDIHFNVSELHRLAMDLLGLGTTDFHVIELGQKDDQNEDYQRPALSGAVQLTIDLALALIKINDSNRPIRW